MSLRLLHLVAAVGLNHGSNCESLGDDSSPVGNQPCISSASKTVKQ